jgi:hypothetical protein
MSLISESFLIYKLHRSLILKNKAIVAPYLADDLAIIGAKPFTVIGDNDKELLVNWLGAVEFGGDMYYFKSAFTKINFERKMKSGLSVEYFVIKERWLKLDVHINFSGGKINRLFNTVIECSTNWGSQVSN